MKPYAIPYSSISIPQLHERKLADYTPMSIGEYSERGWAEFVKWVLLAKNLNISHAHAMVDWHSESRLPTINLV